MSIKTILILMLLIGPIFSFSLGRHLSQIKSARQEFDDYHSNKIESIWIRLNYINMGVYPKLWKWAFKTFGDPFLTRFFKFSGYFFMVISLLAFLTGLIFIFALPNEAIHL